MRLRIVDHLDPVLDRPQQAIGTGQLGCDLAVQPARFEQCANCIKGRRRAHPLVTAAVDHLLDLNEEFDLPDAAAAALQVIAGPNESPLGEVVADPRRDLPHLLDYAEIERAPPHERLDGAEETSAKREIAGGG